MILSSTVMLRKDSLEYDRLYKELSDPAVLQRELSLALARVSAPREDPLRIASALISRYSGSAAAERDRRAVAADPDTFREAAARPLDVSIGGDSTAIMRLHATESLRAQLQSESKLQAPTPNARCTACHCALSAPVYSCRSAFGNYAQHQSSRQPDSSELLDESVFDSDEKDTMTIRELRIPNGHSREIVRWHHFCGDCHRVLGNTCVACGRAVPGERCLAAELRAVQLNDAFLRHTGPQPYDAAIPADCDP